MAFEKVGKFLFQKNVESGKRRGADGSIDARLIHQGGYQFFPVPWVKFEQQELKKLRPNQA